MLPPLVLVIMCSMIKDGYEDYCRHIEDATENNALCTRYNRRTHQFEKVRWGDVVVGDFVKVAQDEFFCADMVVVKSTEDEGVCFVETKNLDGETNLKNKVVPKDLWGKFDHMQTAITNFEGSLSIDGPNNLIYKFEGQMEMKKESRLINTGEDQMQQIGLSNDNILLRGMSLRNVEEILGIVVYTGHETKIQMNTTKSSYKVSKMMQLTNMAIL